MCQESLWDKMINLIKRDLTEEFCVLDQLRSQITCGTIGGDTWQIGRAEDDIICLSHNSDLLYRYLQVDIVRLDGERMILPAGKQDIELIIRRSLVTTKIPDACHPKIIAKLFEFGIEGVGEISIPMEAIVPVGRGVKIPTFLNYFGHFVSAADRLCCTVDLPRGGRILNGIAFNFQGQSFLVYAYGGADKGAEQWLVVETESASKYSTFCQNVRRVLSALGFFTGDYCFGPLWVFHPKTHAVIAYNDCMTKGGTAKYHMWSLNPYEYLADADKEPCVAQEIEKELKPITRGQFEKLLVLLDEERYSYFFYIFQDINLKMSHLMASAKFPAYAACLEACKEWWIHNNPHHSAMLYTEEQRLEIIGKMEELLMTHYADSPDTTYVLEKKIKNQSIFRAGNMDELKAAIAGIGMTLSKEEIKALGWRNDILHGRDIIKSTFANDSPSAYINEMERKLFMLHEIIWRFIMKSIGYDGFYVDVAKVNELFRDSKSNGGLPLKRQV